MDNKINVIYLDNNATTRVAPEVADAMIPFLRDYYGNPSSMYSFGDIVAKKIRESREKITDLLNCNEEEIIFTSCGSESDNAAILSALATNSDKKHIITTEVEHPAVLELCKYLGDTGYDVTFLKVDEFGRLDLDELKDAIRDDTAIVSIMYANNETGNIFDVPKIAEIVKSRGVLFHTDAVQAVGKLPIDLEKLPVDFLSLSGHKLHAPKGVGALYVRKGVKFHPFLKGGHQELGRRAGTENAASIIGLGLAAELSKNNMSYENSFVKMMRDKLESGIENTVSDIKINGDRENRLPNTTNISFGNVEGEAILLMMNELYIAASSGSACTTGSLDPSHVLQAMGVSYKYIHGSIRFSLSRYTTEEEIDYVLKELPPIIENLRALSPFKN